MIGGNSDASPDDDIPTRPGGDGRVVDSGSSGELPYQARPSNNTAFVLTRDYTGKIFNGARAIANLTLRVDEGSHAVEVVFVNNNTFDRFNGLKQTGAGKRLVITRFPVLNAPWGPNDRGGARRVQPDCKATIEFAPRGDPASQSNKLFGIIKTSLSQVMRFEVSGGSQAEEQPGSELPPAAPFPPRIPQR